MLYVAKIANVNYLCIELDKEQQIYASFPRIWMQSMSSRAYMLLTVPL
jgi:hypothetical protein